MSLGVECILSAPFMDWNRKRVRARFQPGLETGM